MMTQIIKLKKVSPKSQTRVVEQDLRGQFFVDGTARMVMEGLEGRVSPQLPQMMTAMLLGFNDDMQLEIADDLLDFACQHIVHTTGCPTADALLVTCYGWIAEEQGFTLRVKSLESGIKN